MYKYMLPLLCGTGVSLTGMTSALAQDSAAVSEPQLGRALEEIVVTSRRMEESLQDVPVAVTAITQEQLLNNSTTDLTKLAELAPQVLIGEFGSGTTALLTVRGIGSDAIDFGLDQSVMIVVDGVPINSGGVIRQSLFDMQQVEVMAGPQALFFGKNSPAGVISLQTADPTNTLEGYLRASYEPVADERRAEGAISGPITETLKARLALRASDMEGWLENNAQSIESPFHAGVILPGDVNNRSPQSTHYAGRFSLQWTPSDDFDAQLKLTLDEQNLDGNGWGAFNEIWCTDGAAAPLTQGRPQVGADCNKNRQVAVSANAPRFAVNFPYGNNGVPYRDSDFGLASLTFNKRFGNVTLTSTSGYYDQNNTGSACSEGAFCQLYSVIRTDFEQVTQELRLNTDFPGPVNFMGGLYFEHHERYWFTAVDFFHANLNPVTNNYATWENEANGTYDGYSAFAQVRWNILPSLELAVGARYSNDEKDADIVNTAVNPVAPFPLRPAGQPIHAEISDENVSPEATLTWFPDSNQTLYAAYKTGYKAGGISNPQILFASLNNPDTFKFEREKAEGFEVGYKADLLERTLRLNLAAYRYRLDDLQVVSENINLFLFTIGNAGAARTEGVELSSLWRATERLSFNANAGYNRARYLSYPGAQCYAGQTAALGCVGGKQDLSGERTTRAPEVTFNLGVNYEAKLPGWTADLSLGGAYTSWYHASTTLNPGGIQPSFWRLNAAVHLTPDDGKFGVSVIGRNLTNEYYLVAASNLPFGSPNNFIGPFARPREVLLQLQYNF